MDAKELFTRSLKKAALHQGNLITGAISLAASAALANPLPLILWGLGATGWTVMASTGKKYQQQILEEERRAREAKVDADREALRQKVETSLREPPLSVWTHRGLLPDYMKAYFRLIEVRDRVARVLRERAQPDGGILQQLNYMLTAYLHFVRERVIYLHILSNIRPGADAPATPGGSSGAGGRSAIPPPPPAGLSPGRWERITRSKPSSKGQTSAPAEHVPSGLPSIELRLSEIDEKVARLRALAEKEPATARTRQWHIGILEKQRELLLECQKRDQTVVAQLGAFADVFEVILGRVSASQFSATEIASYMGSVVEQIEETERFVESMRPAMEELMGGLEPGLTRWPAST